MSQTARSNTKKYSKLMSQVGEGLARVVGERYLSGGVIERDFASQMQQNPEMRSIEFGAAFLKAAIRDYQEWRVKWWRECIQNSLDAGAHNIKTGIIEQDDGSIVAYCEDDGSGMDEATLVGKFLVMSETTKPSYGGTVGGFGEAKRLLILPWIRWTIRTRDLMASGSGVTYALERGLPYVSGARLEVQMPEGEHTNKSDLIELLQRSSLGRANIFVDGERYTTWVHRGRKIRDFEGKAEVYYNKSTPFPALLVRAGGLFMHSRWLSSDFKGTVFVELTGPSTKLLTSNRDSIADPSLSREIDGLINELSADVSSAVRKKSKAFEKVYEGEKFRAEQDTAYAVGQVGPVPSVGEGESIDISGDALQRLLDALGSIQLAREKDDNPTDSASPEITKIMLEGLQLRGASDVESTVAQLAWKPAFFVMNEIEDYKVPKKFMPETMTPKVRALAQLWGELCRWVLIQLGSTARFGVGFVFSEGAAAMYAYKAGAHWILLNPFMDVDAREDIWSKTGAKDLRWLYAAAIHECTHMADGVMYHNEAFSSAMTRNVAKCADGFRRVKAIANAVRERAPRGEGAAKEPRKKEPVTRDTEFTFSLWARRSYSDVTMTIPRNVAEFIVAEYWHQDAAPKVFKISRESFKRYIGEVAWIEGEAGSVTSVYEYSGMWPKSAKISVGDFLNRLLYVDYTVTEVYSKDKRKTKGESKSASGEPDCEVILGIGGEFGAGRAVYPGKNAKKAIGPDWLFTESVWPVTLYFKLDDVAFDELIDNSLTYPDYRSARGAVDRGVMLDQLAIEGKDLLKLVTHYMDTGDITYEKA